MFDNIADGAEVLDDISDGAKVFDNTTDAVKAVDNTANVSRIVKEADDISGAIEIADKTKGATVAANLPDVDILSKRTIEIAQNAPIKIPKYANVKIEKKTAYTQMKYIWNDGVYEYTGRWHTRTPKAPQEQGVTWVIERRIIGQGYGKYARQGVKEVMVRINGVDEWIPEDAWKAARNARGLGTATIEQEVLLNGGHYADNTKL